MARSCCWYSYRRWFPHCSYIRCSWRFTSKHTTSPNRSLYESKSKEESLEQTNYLLSLTCSEEHEAHIRFLLMHMVSSEGIGLKELYSEDVDSNQKVCIQATLHCNTNTAVLIEK